MSIKDWGEKIKWQGRKLLNGVRENGRAGKYYTAAIVILVGLSSFGLGRFSVIDEGREPITIEQNEGVVASSTQSKIVIPETESQTQTASAAKSLGAGDSSSGKLVASKSGTKYYFPWCSGAAKIADANKVWFNSEADARAKGYQPAANCKGLK